MDKLLQLLRERGLTLATAESCTGGMLGSLITAIPGSSDVYVGGVVSYSNEIKHRLLHVPEDALMAHGAVSRQVAGAMAQGVREVCGASVGVGITGIAGPGSDGTSKPVGLVYVGCSTEQGVVVCELHLSGSREEIRRESCRQAALLITDQIS